MFERHIPGIVFAALIAAGAALAGEKRPAPTGFAALADVDRLPTWSEPVRVQYSTFLAMLGPRAFALSPDGTHWAWQSGNANAMRDALQRCDQRAEQKCKLYAVDDDVVWPVK